MVVPTTLEIATASAVGPGCCRAAPGESLAVACASTPSSCSAVKMRSLVASKATQVVPRVVMSGFSLRSAVLTVTGLAKPSARAARVTTWPVRPETTCTLPLSSTAMAGLAPTVAKGLVVGANSPRSPSGAWGSKRWAQTLPVLGSTVATVPARRSIGRGLKVPASVTGKAGAWDPEPAELTLGSIGSNCPVPLARPRTAEPSCSTSRPLPSGTSVETPASSCSIGVLSRPNFARVADVTQTPESLSLASWTFSPELAVAA